MKDLVRHGDLLFRQIGTPEVGDGVGRKLRRAPGRVIQRGEVTGHAHRISEGEAMILEQYEETWVRGKGHVDTLAARFLEVKTPATIIHEEHGPVTLAPGLYEVLQAREFDYAANLGRRVRD